MSLFLTLKIFGVPNFENRCFGVSVVGFKQVNDSWESFPSPFREQVKILLFYIYFRKRMKSTNYSFQEKRIKTIIREIVVHTSFVALCILICYATLDANQQRLFQSAFDLLANNGITKAYFNGKTYESRDWNAQGKNKSVKLGPKVF